MALAALRRPLHLFLLLLLAATLLVLFLFHGFYSRAFSSPIFGSQPLLERSEHSLRYRQTEEQDEGQNKPLTLGALGVLSSMDGHGWRPKECQRSRKLRQASVKTSFGNMSLYIYDSAQDDDTFTKQIEQQSSFFEYKEMTEFLRLSRDLPLIDVGGNIGLVTLQAAIQGRRVVVLEPIPENALRLCRAVIDFGHGGLVHVIQNAVSSSEGNVTLAMDRPVGRARYSVNTADTHNSHGAIQVFALRLDRLLELLPFRRAALKIDVENHEGHVLAGAERLFREVDIPVLWMEWEHLASLQNYGAVFVAAWLRARGMEPYDLMSGRPLDDLEDLRQWPRTVLWRK